MVRRPLQLLSCRLLRLANTAGIALLRRWGPRLKLVLSISGRPSDCLDGKEAEAFGFSGDVRLSTAIRLRIRATLWLFDGAGYHNLTVELHDRVFRIEKSEDG